MKTLTIALLALVLAACGGGRDDDAEQRKNDPSPDCAMHPQSCK